LVLANLSHLKSPTNVGLFCVCIKMLRCINVIHQCTELLSIVILNKVIHDYRNMGAVIEEATSFAQ